MENLDQLKPRVLILEDEQELATVLAEMISKANFNVDICNEVPKAMLALSEKKYDVAVFDYHLENSISTSAILESRFLIPEFPEFFVLSGDSSLQQHSESSDYEIISKPVGLASLTDKVKELWNKRTSNKRRYRRKAVQLSGELVCDGHRTPIQIKNLSLEGAHVTAPHPLENYNDGFLRIHPIQVKPHCLLGRIDVAWSMKADPEYEAGIRFRNPLQPLQAFFTALKARP